MREHFLPLLALAVVSVCGCTMIPGYQRPASPVPPRFPLGSGDAGIAADIRWRDFFADPRLKRLVELSLENNRDLRVAALRVEQFQAEYRIQRAALFPTVDAGGGYTRARTGGQISNLYSVSVAATAYEVDLFGRVRSLNRQALETYFASDQARRSAEISLVAQVATQYLGMLEEQEQLNLARHTLTSVQASYDLNKQGFDDGKTSALDLSTADAQVQSARASVFQYERLVAQAANLLAQLVGRELPADLPPGRSLSEQGTFTELPAGLPSDLIARRPDILSAEHTLLAANANIGAARAAFFPVIALTASGGYTSFQLSHLFTPASAVWAFAPQISIPIFNGGNNVAALDVAQVSKRIEVATYEETIQTAFREVADALVARDRYILQLGAQQSLVAAEQRRYDLSNLRYREGVDSYLTVLTAQQDLYTSQSSLINNRTDRLANLITLYKTLGGGWQ